MVAQYAPLKRTNGNRPMTFKTKLLAAASAFILSATAAAAAPAITTNDLNMRSGPGTEYGVVGTIPAGETVDVGGCTGSWCAVNFNGRSGYSSANYLSGGGQATGVVVEPQYGYGPDYAYGDDYYGPGYSYGPSIGIYAGPRYRSGWNRSVRGGNWRGRPAWNGNRTGDWQGGSRMGNRQGRGNRVGNAGGQARVGGGAGPRMSAPAGMTRGGGPRGGAAMRSGARVGGGAAPSGGVSRGIVVR